MFVGRTGTDGGKIFFSSSIEGLGVFESEEKRCLGRGERGGKHALNRINEILGFDGIAVGPPRAITQLESVNEAVRRYVPTNGCARLGLAAIRGRQEQSFAQCADDEKFIGQ